MQKGFLNLKTVDFLVRLTAAMGRSGEVVQHVGALMCKGKSS